MPSSLRPTEKTKLKKTSSAQAVLFTCLITAATGGASAPQKGGKIMGKLFYGTMTGNTAAVAEVIQDALVDLVDEVRCIDRAQADDLRACDLLILGGSTWGDGELTDDWADFMPQLDQIDFKGKTVALFSVGDQISYTYNFVSAMKLLYDKVKERGARVIADKISVDGFEFAHSESVLDGAFVGLVIDEMNEAELTQARIERWAQTVRQEAGVAIA
jgi:flavodoxin I